MKITATIDLNEVSGFDGDTIATTVAEEIRAQIKSQVRKSMLNDPQVARLIQEMKKRSVEKLMADLSK